MTIKAPWLYRQPDPPKRYLDEAAVRRRIEALLDPTDTPTPVSKANNKPLLALLRWLDSQ